MKRIEERPLPALTVPQQTVLVGMLGQFLTTAAVIAFVESREEKEKPSIRRERYAALAGGIISTGILGAVVLALNADSDGLRGNVG